MCTAMLTESFTFTTSRPSAITASFTSSQHSYMRAVSPGSLPAQLKLSTRWMSQ